MKRWPIIRHLRYFVEKVRLWRFHRVNKSHYEKYPADRHRFQTAFHYYLERVWRGES